MCTRKGTKNLITVLKLCCNAEYCRLGKGRRKTTAKYIQFDAWARADTKRCNAKRVQG